MSNATAAEPKTVLSSREIYRNALMELLPSDERLVCLDTDTGLFNGVDLTPHRTATSTSASPSTPSWAPPPGSPGAAGSRS